MGECGTPGRAPEPGGLCSPSGSQLCRASVSPGCAGRGGWDGPAQLGFSELKLQLKEKEQRGEQPSTGCAAPTHGEKDEPWGAPTVTNFPPRLQSLSREGKGPESRGAAEPDPTRKPVCRAVPPAHGDTGRLASLSPSACAVGLFFFPSPLFFFPFICFSNNVTHPEQDGCAPRSRVCLHCFLREMLTRTR